MNREEAKIILDTFKNNPLFNEQHKQAFDMAISALSADPCENCKENDGECCRLLFDSAEGEYIKKEDAINDRKIYALWNGSEFVYVVNADYLKSLPTYSFPDREKGEWKEVGDEYVEAYDIEGVHTYADKRMCSKCGFVTYFIEGHGIYTFCPNCGADMRRGKANDKEEM